MEFEVKCPSGTTPHGICFAEYQGQEIVVCCLWKRGSINIQCFQGYDLQGKLLQIPQEELEKSMGSLLENIKFQRRYVLRTRREPWTLALFDKCISETGLLCDAVDIDKLTLANAVWKEPLDIYTCYEMTLEEDNPYISTFDFNCVTISTRFQEFPPVFTTATVSFQPFMFHIWGVSSTDGKEVVYYCSPNRGNDVKFLPVEACLDSNLQHIVVVGGDDSWKNQLQIYDLPENFIMGQPCFYYRASEKAHIRNYYFLSPDLFCFTLVSGGGRGSTQKCHVLLYSFSENRIVADTILNHRFSSPCSPWEQPWGDVSRDGKRLAIGFERTNSLKPVSSRDDFQTWVRVYQLEP